MDTKEFQTHIQAEISPDLYIEPALEDRERVMIKHPEGKSPIYVCAVPPMLKDEPDNNYKDHFGGRYPSRPEVEGKIRNFIEKLPENLELYD